MGYQSSSHPKKKKEKKEKDELASRYQTSLKEEKIKEKGG
jgi:hypothetical protein